MAILCCADVHGGHFVSVCACPWLPFCVSVRMPILCQCAHALAGVGFIYPGSLLELQLLSELVAASIGYGFHF